MLPINRIQQEAVIVIAVVAVVLANKTKVTCHLHGYIFFDYVL